MLPMLTSTISTRLSTDISRYLTRGSLLWYLWVYTLSTLRIQGSNPNPVEINKILTELRTAHVLWCWFKHHNTIELLPWATSKENVIRILTEWDPQNCPRLTKNLACGHPTIWTIPTLTRAFVYCFILDCKNQNELLELLKIAWKICRELSAEDHYHFDQVESWAPTYWIIDTQYELGEKMRGIFSRLADKIESSL